MGGRRCDGKGAANPFDLPRHDNVGCSTAGFSLDGGLWTCKPIWVPGRTGMLAEECGIQQKEHTYVLCLPRWGTVWVLGGWKWGPGFLPKKGTWLHLYPLSTLL
eukprot:1144253-Pelagomonas_calceolata.AAC.3